MMAEEATKSVGVSNFSVGFTQVYGRHLSVGYIQLLYVWYLVYLDGPIY